MRRRLFTARNLSYQARHYWDVPADVRDHVADVLGDTIYYCPECDEEHDGDPIRCPRFPREHDNSGYMGSGTDYPEPMRRLANSIADD